MYLKDKEYRKYFYRAFNYSAYMLLRLNYIKMAVFNKII